MNSIVLASTSPYRKQLLEKLSITFVTAKPNVDETPILNESPNALVERLAILKAQAVAKQHNNALVIGSDQVAVHEGKILGKPHTKENARKQLMSFSGNKVTFLTGLCVLNASSGEFKSLVEPFNVYFRTLTENEVDLYIEIEQPLNCAGSFKSEGLGICLFNKLEGNDPNTLIGLPLIQLTNLLKAFGYNVLDSANHSVEQ
ncbi:Maf family protein [Thalassotalea fusca]